MTLADLQGEHPQCMMTIMVTMPRMDSILRRAHHFKHTLNITMVIIMVTVEPLNHILPPLGRGAIIHPATQATTAATGGMKDLQALREPTRHRPRRHRRSHHHG